MKKKHCTNKIKAIWEKEVMFECEAKKREWDRAKERENMNASSKRIKYKTNGVNGFNEKCIIYWRFLKANSVKKFIQAFIVYDLEKQM